MKSWARFALAAVLAVAYTATAWVAGLVVLVLGAVVLLRRIERTRRASAPTTLCPWCHAEVPQYGAFSCTSCHARTLGWAWRCGTCGAWAGHIGCPHCGLSVPNPLLPRP